MRDLVGLTDYKAIEVCTKYDHWSQCQIPTKPQKRQYENLLTFRKMKPVFWKRKGTVAPRRAIAPCLNSRRALVFSIFEESHEGLTTTSTQRRHDQRSGHRFRLWLKATK